MLGDDHLRPFDPIVEEYERAVAAGEAVPHEVTKKVFLQAKQFRLPSADDP